MALTGGTTTDLIKCKSNATYNQVQTRPSNEPIVFATNVERDANFADEDLLLKESMLLLMKLLLFSRPVIMFFIPPIITMPTRLL